jgi:Zn-dependent protease
MFGMVPGETPFDLRFRFLGIPVRIQAWFWAVMAFLGGAGQQGVSLTSVLVFMVCALFSILVHEYGHGLMGRWLGYPAAIVLYAMGGLCYTQGERQRPWERLLVTLCGPGAGLLLLGVVILIGMGLTSEGVEVSPLGAEVLEKLFIINLFWSLLNLLPVLPLDGGHIVASVLEMINRRDGRRWAHVVSLLGAGLLALFCYLRLNELFLALFFGLMAAANYQALQALHAQYRFGGSHDDWWRR